MPLTSKEVEDAKLHGAQHRQEALTNQESQQEVGSDADRIPT